MTKEEYFGDWAKVIDTSELYKIMTWLKVVNKNTLCPDIKNIFKAFKLCPLTECVAVILSQDPYPQKGVATGITFGNNKEPLSPSLEVIKEGVIDYSIPHNHIDFDNTLESWSSQGILMINSALTCSEGQVGSHASIWKPFMEKLIQNLSIYNTGLVWLLFGSQAQSFRKSIILSSKVLSCYHPAYYARKGASMPEDIFKNFKKAIFDSSGKLINFYTEYSVED